MPKTKEATVTILTKSQAEDLVKKMQRDAEDYDAIVTLFSVTMNAAGLVLGYLGKRYLVNLARELEDVVDGMADDEVLEITTTWRYVNRGKNSGYVPDKVTYTAGPVEKY